MLFDSSETSFYVLETLMSDSDEIDKTSSYGLSI